MVSLRLPNTLDADFCIDALQEALGQGQPEVFNSDQGRPVHQREVIRMLQGTILIVSTQRLPLRRCAKRIRYQIPPERPTGTGSTAAAIARPMRPSIASSWSGYVTTLGQRSVCVAALEFE